MKLHLPARRIAEPRSFTEVIIPQAVAQELRNAPTSNSNKTRRLSCPMAIGGKSFV